MLPTVPTRTAFLLLCRDDNVRWLVGKAWKCCILESRADLEAMLTCLEPYERHFDQETRKMHLLLYRDSSIAEEAAQEWSCLPNHDEAVWIGYTFKKHEKMNDMIADIESDRSVWKRQAVPSLTFSLRLPQSALKSKEGRVIVIRLVDAPVTALASN